MSQPSDVERCVLCGATPTLSLRLRRHVGMVIVQRFVSFERPLCRDHGVAMARDYLKKTAVQGWWGLISFFANWVAIFTDLSALKAYRQLPSPGGPGVDVSMAAPMAHTTPAAPAPTPATATTTAAATQGAWYPDPSGRYHQRWWDGQQWTADVLHEGARAHDPLPQH